MDSTLVTGGAGFLGSHVAEALCRMGQSVVIVDDLSNGFHCNVPKGCHLHRLSITSASAMDALFEQYRFRYVYHLAAYAAEGLSHHIRAFNYTNNLLGSIHLINASVAYGVECFVFTSSIAVYGAAARPFTEATVPVPEDPYGIAKLAVEQDLRTAATLFGLKSVIFRPHNVYGERQNLSDPFRNVLGIFMRRVMAGEPCPIFGDGSQTRAFSYVGDVAPIIARAPLIPAAAGETFNIGADEPVRVDELAEMVQSALGRKTGIEWMPARPEVQHAWSDHAKAQACFGRRRTIGLEEGIHRMARWARTIDIGPPRPACDIEVERGLPPAWRQFTGRSTQAAGVSK
jgi:UDP-glucose 4-epimerase